MYLFRFIESMTKKEEPESNKGASQPPVEQKKQNNRQSSYHSDASSSDTPRQKNFQDKSFRKPEYEKGNRQAFEQKKSFQAGSKKSFDNPERETKRRENKVDSAYVLFSANGESFLGIYKNDKRTFKLDGIEHPEKTGYYSNIARNFINQQIKKKVVFLTIKGEDSEGRLIVDAFLDEEKTQCLNTMMIDEQLHQVKKKSYIKKNINSLKEPKSENLQSNVAQKDALPKSIKPLAGNHDYSSKNFQHLGNIGNIATLVNPSEKKNVLEDIPTSHAQDVSNKEQKIESFVDDNSSHWQDSYENAPVFDEPPGYYDDSYEPVSEEEFFATQEHEPVRHAKLNHEPVLEEQSLPETVSDPELHQPENHDSYQEPYPYQEEPWHHEENNYYDDKEAIPVLSDNDIHREEYEPYFNTTNDYNENNEDKNIPVNLSEDSFFDELMSVESSLSPKTESFHMHSEPQVAPEQLSAHASQDSIGIEHFSISDSDSVSEKENLSVQTNFTYHIDNDPFMKELMSAFDDIDTNTNTASQSIQRNKPKFK
jgi:hypothetical protein